MGSIQLVGLAIGIACGLVLVFDRRIAAVSPHDAKLLEGRYGARGLRVVALRRIGSEFSHNRPIRKYELDLEGLDGHRETRVRGVSRGRFRDDVVWRYDAGGRREPIH